MSDPVDVAVRAGDCPCPGRPHSEEHVYLEPILSLPMASAATAAAGAAEGTLAAQQAALIGAYLPMAIRSWSFIEAAEPPVKGTRPVPITRANMERLLPWDNGGLEVSERADELYSAALLAPLLRRMQRLSEPGPTDGSTSPSPLPGEPTPEPSPPSSPAASAGTPFVEPV